MLTEMIRHAVDVVRNGRPLLAQLDWQMEMGTWKWGHGNGDSAYFPFVTCGIVGHILAVCYCEEEILVSSIFLAHLPREKRPRREIMLKESLYKMMKLLSFSFPLLNNIEVTHG
jgi:hypothetical protein